MKSYEEENRELRQRIEQLESQVRKLQQENNRLREQLNRTEIENRRVSKPISETDYNALKVMFTHGYNMRFLRKFAYAKEYSEAQLEKALKQLEREYGDIRRSSIQSESSKERDKKAKVYLYHLLFDQIFMTWTPAKQEAWKRRHRYIQQESDYDIGEDFDQFDNEIE